MSNTQRYMTTQGDTWDAIARRLYGREHKMHLLIDANPEHRAVVVFSANVQIIAPPLQADDEACPQSAVPWR